MSDSLRIENISRAVNVDQGRFAESVGRVETGRHEADEAHSSGPGPGQAGESARTFSDILHDSIDKVNLYQNQADTAIKELVAGRQKNIHETMLAIERADASLKLMMQVRNKVLDAYREIMRMQV